MTFNETQTRFIKDFASLEDEFDRYSYLTYLGSLLGKPKSEELCIKQNLVKGCQSETWIKVHVQKGYLVLDAYSDTLIVRGLLYILRECMAEMQIQDYSISAFEELYQKTSLTSFLTASRREGLKSILKTIQKQLDMDC